MTRADSVHVTVAPGHEALKPLLALPWRELLERSRPLDGGRGGVRELPGGLVLRRCRRGGALGAWLGDRHFSPRKALQELQVSERLVREGVGVAQVLAVRAERDGLAWHLDVVTVKIPHAAELRALLPAAPVAAVAAAVRRMHDAGLWHADLNLQNILVTRDGAVRIIDLAGSRFAHPLPESARFDNIARLYRSLAKQGLPHSPFSLARFLAVYCRRDRAAMRRAAAATRRRMLRHRLWWAITGRKR